MLFRRLSEYLKQLEETSLRNKMTEILAELFKEASSSEIGKLCYLLQGRVAPLFEAVEFGMGEKMVIRAIAVGSELDTNAVLKIFKNKGDLGVAVEEIKSNNKRHKIYNKKINILSVYDVLYKMATAGGEGSQEGKISFLSNLIKEVDPLSAKYIIKIAIAKLRLGFSDMTVLDSLSWMLKGSKELRPEIERAYNVRPDLGFISQTLKEKGIDGLKHVKPAIGTPILMARAERMSSGKDIIEKIGKCAIEPKYDGLRLQCHLSRHPEPRWSSGRDLSRMRESSDKLRDSSSRSSGTRNDNDVVLFSRNLENTTGMYPDIAEGIRKQIKAKEAILEGEAIAYDPATGEYLPFQETVQRKRKYDIEAKAKEIPLHLFTFDCLYVDGESLLGKSYTQRRERLTDIIGKGGIIRVAEEKITDDPKKIEEVFSDATTRGLEGVMAKKLDGIYQAGARDFNWIKYKRSYASKLSDTIDAVVMGFDRGQGKRMGFGIGDFLIGVLDEKREMFATVAKIGTGLTDEEWKTLKVTGDKLKVTSKPKNYDVDKMMECDVWVEPEIVVEIRADEITRSPVHTAGRILKRTKSGGGWEVNVAGFALRFPRLERFREDKKPEDATTIAELKRMYEMQGRKN